jgi:hypothetical protein
MGSKGAQTEISELISDIYASLPPEKRTSANFLALAKYSLLLLTEAKKSVAKAYLDNDLSNNPGLFANPRLWSSPLVFKRNRAYVPQALFDMIADAQDFLDGVIPILALEPPESPAPEYVWPLFYNYPGVKLTVPVFTVPLRAIHEAETVGGPELEVRLLMSSLTESIQELPDTLTDAGKQIVAGASYAAETAISEASKVISRGLGVPTLLIGAALGIGLYAYAYRRK